MQQVFAAYPNPTVDNGDGFSGTLFFPSSSKTDTYNIVAKIDQHFTDRHTLSLRYGYDHSADPNAFHSDFLPGNIGAIATKSITQALSAQLTSTLSNTLVNNFQFGWNEIYATFNMGKGTLSVLDSPGGLDRFGNGRDYILDPFSSFASTLGGSNSQDRHTGTVSYTENISWVRGAHTFKFGFDFRNIGERGPDNFSSRRQVLTNTFVNTGFSLLTGVNNSSIALEDAASALYGFAWEDTNAEFFNKSATRVGSDDKRFRQHEYDWYGQDTWKLRRNLTLTLGLRYQLDGVPYEQSANFSNLLTDPASFPVVFSIVGPGTGKSIYQPDHSGIEPRVGFSWDPWGDGKTAVRAGIGIFHDRVFGNLFGNARGNPPFEQDYFNFPFETVNDFFGSGAFPAVVPDTIPDATIADGTGISPVVFDTHFRNATSNNWNFDIQRELPGNNTIDVAYVGSEGHHIYRQRDGDPPDPALVQQLIAFCIPTNPLNTLGCTRSTVASTNLYFGAEFGVLPFDAVAHNALFQPFYQISVGNSIYNSLQAKITHRMSHGLQVQGSYTWAHGIDDASDPLNPAAGNRTFPRNSLNLAQDRGNSDNDIRHIFVLNYVWEMPIGRGKSYLNHGVVGKVFEGWQFSGITHAQTGHPFDIRSRRDSQGTGIAAWASRTGDPFAAGVSSSPLGKVFFTNPGAFVTPDFGGPGSLGRNPIYGPHYVDFDMAHTPHPGTPVRNF
jgi:hypothetical protein